MGPETLISSPLLGDAHIVDPATTLTQQTLDSLSRCKLLDRKKEPS